MPTLPYKALQADGTIAEGLLEAAGRQEALRQMERLGLRPVNLRGKSRRKRIAKTARRRMLLPPCANFASVRQRIAKKFPRRTGKFHAFAVQLARGGRAVEPRAGDSCTRKRLARRCKRQMEGNPRPRGGRHVAGRRDGEIAGNFSARLCRDGARRAKPADFSTWCWRRSRIFRRAKKS